MTTEAVEHQRGHLFIFEGPDGVGKTSLVRAIVELLVSSSVPCQYLASPGQREGTLGHHIYELHHNRSKLDIKAVSPTALQAMHIAAHIDTIDNLIKPILSSGTSIVLDRFWWSTLVYGQVYGANMQTLSSLVEGEIIHWGSLKPDHIFLIGREDPIGEESNSQWKQLLKAYAHLFAEKQIEGNVSRIENSLTLEHALYQVTEVIRRFLPIVS